MPTAVRSTTVQSYNATQATVNDNIAVTGKLVVDTVTSKTAAKPVVANDGLTVNSELIVDTITKRSSNEVTVGSNFAAGGQVAGRYI